MLFLKQNESDIYIRRLCDYLPNSIKFETITMKGIQKLAKVGVKAIIQPGGSINDKKIIAAANNAGIVMAFTGTRHFKH